MLHNSSHLGIDHCIKRTKGSVYWPGITEDIKSIMNKCEKCLSHSRHNQKEPFIPIDIPIVAWKVVATDLFVFQNCTYILVTDLFSHFPVVNQLRGESAKLVLDALKDIFCDFGILESIISDNGPCYRSQEFSQFCSRFEIKHITGAAYNHQANAIAERSMQTIKHLMAKNQGDYWLALLILKTTPITGIDKSPLELLCNRRFRTNLPIIQQASELADKAKLQNNDSNRYQTGSKALVPIPIGSHVLYDSNPDSSKAKRPEWSKGIVKDFNGPDRKYTIENDSGRQLTRTRRDIRPSEHLIAKL